MDDWLILTTVFNTGIDSGLDIDSSRDLAIAEWFVAKKEHEASWPGANGALMAQISLIAVKHAVADWHPGQS